MDRSRDGQRFDRWAETYDDSRLQGLVFDKVHGTVLEVARQEAPHARAVLDVGCGTGRLLRAVAGRYPEARLVGVDPARRMLDHARAAPGVGKIEFLEGSADQLPLGDAEFDLVFSTLTFHHWSSQERGAREVARVMSPGGIWLLADFVPSGLVGLTLRALRQRRFPSRRQLERLLPPAGLRIARMVTVPRLGGQVAVVVISKGH